MVTLLLIGIIGFLVILAIIGIIVRRLLGEDACDGVSCRDCKNRDCPYNENY